MSGSDSTHTKAGVRTRYRQPELIPEATPEGAPKPQRPEGIFGRLTSALRAEWREVGILGRVAFLGLLVSLAVAIGLGFWIPDIASRHVLGARAELMESIGNQIASQGLLPIGPPGSESYAQFAEAVERRLVGGETVRVKMWSLGGVILYSDDPGLVGREFGLSAPARAALDGETQFHISDLGDAAHAGERDLGELIEFYVPVESDSGALLGLLEIEQSVGQLTNTRSHIQRNVWVAILGGIGVLSVFMATLTVASARLMNRRRIQAERLLASLFGSQEMERKRTVGALHDDIGQPLYRLLYGIQALRSRLSEDDTTTDELRRLESITRDIDHKLRAELRLLHGGVKDELSLSEAIDDLVEMTERETGLRVDARIEPGSETLVSDVARIALIHAAGEGLINVRKHADADHVQLTVKARKDSVLLELTDNGKGIENPEGLGLVTLRERLEAIGGGLKVSSRTGNGTRVLAWVPHEMDTP